MNELRYISIRYSKFFMNTSFRISSSFVALLLLSNHLVVSAEFLFAQPVNQTKATSGPINSVPEIQAKLNQLQDTTIELFKQSNATAVAKILPDIRTTAQEYSDHVSTKKRVPFDSVFNQLSENIDKAVGLAKAGRLDMSQNYFKKIQSNLRLLQVFMR